MVGFVVKSRQKWVSTWRILGDEKFGQHYIDDGPNATGLIPARLVYQGMEYTDLGVVSPASCCVFDYKFNHPRTDSEEGYELHYIWAD